MTLHDGRPIGAPDTTPILLSSDHHGRQGHEDRGVPGEGGAHRKGDRADDWSLGGTQSRDEWARGRQVLAYAGAIGEDGGKDPRGVGNHGKLDLIDVSAQCPGGRQSAGDGAGKGTDPLIGGRSERAAHLLRDFRADANPLRRRHQEAHGRQGSLGDPVGDTAQGGVPTSRRKRLLNVPTEV